MPPRRSSRVVAAAARACEVLPALPRDFVLNVLAQLPADSRLLCAAVSRGWRATLADRCYWKRVDLSAAAGLARPATDALLAAAAARAGGQLEWLDVSGSKLITAAALLQVVRANAASLRHVRTINMGWDTQCDIGRYGNGSVDEAAELLEAAPELLQLDTDAAFKTMREAHAMLRHEPPFGPLRVHTLRGALAAYDLELTEEENAEEGKFVALAADMAAHRGPLQAVEFMGDSDDEGAPPDTVELNAFVDVMVDRRISCVLLDYPNINPESLPVLARLVRDNTALTELRVHGRGANEDVDKASATVLARAFRDSRSLARLTLTNVELFADSAVMRLVLGALTGHPTLRMLDLSYNHDHPEVQESKRKMAAAGAALAALLTADAPALEELYVLDLLPAALGPLLDALPLNTHLRGFFSGVRRDPKHFSEAFARARLLPAVRANTSLREINAWGDGSKFGLLPHWGEQPPPPPPSVQEAVELVRQRAERDRLAPVQA